MTPSTNADAIIQTEPLPSSRGFLEDGDLSRVVKLVLRDAVKHVVEIVFLARDAIAQAGFG
jgi:hypothetical protein